MASINLSTIIEQDRVTALSVNQEIYYLGCWHRPSCSLFLDHGVTQGPSSEEFDLAQTLNRMEQAQPPARAEEDLQDCICTEPRRWHFACCKLATFCPECQALKHNCLQGLCCRPEQRCSILSSIFANARPVQRVTMSVNSIPEFQILPVEGRATLVISGNPGPVMRSHRTEKARQAEQEMKKRERRALRQQNRRR